MLLRVTDGRVRVCRQDKSRLSSKHVQASLQGVRSVTIGDAFDRDANWIW